MPEGTRLDKLDLRSLCALPVLVFVGRVAKRNCLQYFFVTTCVVPGNDSLGLVDFFSKNISIKKLIFNTCFQNFESLLKS